MCTRAREAQRRKRNRAFSELKDNFACIEILGKEQRKTSNGGVSESNDPDDAILIGLDAETETRPELGKAGRVRCIALEKIEESTGVAPLGVKNSTDLACAIRMIQQYDPGKIVSSLGRKHNLNET